MSLLHCLYLSDSLAGRSCREAQVSEGRWGEDPKSGSGHPPVLQLILPPLSTGPDQTHTREFFLELLAIPQCCS